MDGPPPYLQDDGLESQRLLVQAIRSLEVAYTSQQSIIRKSKNPKVTREALQRDAERVSLKFKQALHLLSLLHICLFDTECQASEKTNVWEALELVDPIPEPQQLLIQEPCNTLMPYIPSTGLSPNLRQFRQMLEIFFETRSGGIPRDIVESLHALEERFHLERDPTTNNVWNINYADQRIEVFEKSDEGIIFRQQCACDKSADPPVHDDVYCPRNINDAVEEEKPVEETVAEPQAETEAEAKKPKDPTKKTRSKALMARAMDLVGRDNVKAHFRHIEKMVSENYQKEKPWEGKYFGAVFFGPGNTGKINIARDYANYLISCGISNDYLQESDANALVASGEPKQTLKNMKADGGVLIINDAHNLISYRHKQRSALQHIMDRVEKRNGKITLVLSGHEQQLNTFLAQSGSRKLVPYELPIPALTHEEVGRVLKTEMKNWFGEEAQVEDGWDGLYVRIAAKRIIREEKIKENGGSVSGGVKNLCMNIWKRQNERLQNLRKEEEKVVSDALQKALSEVKSEAEKGTSSVEVLENKGSIETVSLEQKIPEPQQSQTEVPEIKLDSSKLEAKKKSEEAPAIQTTEQKPAEQQPASQKIEEQSGKKNLSAENASELKNGQLTPPVTPGEEKPETPAEKETEDASNNITPPPEQDPEISSPETPANEAQPEATSSDDATKPEGETKIEETKLTEEKKEVKDPKSLYFTKDDILGPSPAKTMLESESWKKLLALTGLETVKKSLLNLSELAKTNYQRELQEKPLLDFTFNRLFLGPPGTGKTVVANLYGKILAEMGVLSKGDVVVKNASSLLGKYIGHSEANVEKALEDSKGSVLVIDEAYTLYTKNSCGDSTSDVFRQAIVDTLVAGIQNVPGEDRCVILLGYEDKMRDFITKSNPGLARRFPMEDAFIFENFTLPQLESILRSKLDEGKLDATEEAIKVAMSVLDKARARLNFGNGGDVENLITRAKSNCLNRIIELPEEARPGAWMFEPQDFDPDYLRHLSADENLHKLFKGVVDCEPIIEKFSHYQKICKSLKARSVDPTPYIPTTFVFKGPPGTGKTTTARKVAQIYYDMGFLSEAEVIECSVTDLIGSYVGQTGPKTVNALEKGLGKVLFIDEAYRLAESSSFATEAVSELVDQLTKPKFLGKIIVILAGYEDEMNALLSVNPGLASRFSEELKFTLLTPAGCLEVLNTKLGLADITFPTAEEKTSSDFSKLERAMKDLSETKGWGNARDVETLSKTISGRVFVENMDVAEGEKLVCSPATALKCMEELLKERKARNSEEMRKAFGLYI
ncbi:P-loop containing nucleoside triphosphate hydrolase protein [Bisporella sp. PMI_857]|nr:P-loop containing nucleoside triphosphate hydrolase protein [Bisporella sp. PMI_857]